MDLPTLRWITRLWPLFLLALWGLAAAAPSLVIQPLTWNVIGLDSNNVNDGPNIFPVGARVCNVGDATATGAQARFVFDGGTTNSFVALHGLSTITLKDLPAGPAPAHPNKLSSTPANCQDAIFNVQITRSASAYSSLISSAATPAQRNTQLYHIEATATGTGVVSTPTPRELFVEKLVSQNRNYVISFTGPSTVAVGQEVELTLTASTATNGYEQMENYPILVNTVFQILNVTSTYNSPAGAINSSPYADACGWENVINSVNYHNNGACIGPANYAGGKVGDTLTTTYRVRIVGGGVQGVFNVIYDFSGSSYHYNSDYGTSRNGFTITAVRPDLTLTKTHTGIFTAGQPGSFTFTVRATDADVYGTTTVTDALPAGLTLPDGPVTVSGPNASSWACTALNSKVTCTSTNTSATTPLLTAGSASTFTISGVTVGSAAFPSTTNTATVSNPNETATGNNAASDPVSVNLPPTAASDAVTTPYATSVTLNVLANDTDAAPGTINAATVDLDPGVTGLQTSRTVAGQGTFTVSSAGVVTFTPVTGFSGVSSVTYTVQDNQGALSNAAAITVTVRPLAVNDTNTTPSNQAVTTSVLGNDAGSALNPSSVVFPAAGQPTGSAVTSSGKILTVTGQGTYTVNPDGTVTFTPATNYTGTASAVTYQVSDGSGQTATATLTVTVTNRPPTASNDSAIITAPGQPITLPNVTSNDTDPDGTLNLSTLTFVNAPTGGTLSNGGQTLTITGQGTWTLNRSTGAVTFTPQSGFVTNPTPAQYTVQDSQGATSNAATITLTVSSAVDVTVTKAAPAYAKAAEPLTYTLTVKVSGGPASAVQLTDPLPAGVTFQAASDAGSYDASSRTVTWVLGALPTGTRTVTVTVLAPTGAQLTADANVRTLVNTASVTTATPEADATNNSATAQTLMVHAPLTKTVRNVTRATAFGSAGGGLPGERLEYCIAFLNAGGVALPNFVLVDPVPANTRVDVNAYDAARANGSAGNGIQLTRAGLGYLSSAQDTDAGSLSSAGGTFGQGVMTVRLGTLAPNEQGNACFQVTIR
ncbi:tandem-95 repeat protein (plasmid) [Deinococcus taeanensis]|uniref:Ig-like domain-containing protein n=1 Tax=Deinococcus taeanensis TaxID=2737050 RepID=UPI001CDB6B42|nr:tandem-95 repeat protein [Deinococcus taeanensis]UBV45067.1 tandem-95 repeat protein [Deinococcus taeanensis]